jgi:hypothetical protein
MLQAARKRFAKIARGGARRVKAFAPERQALPDRLPIDTAEVRTEESKAPPVRGCGPDLEIRLRRAAGGSGLARLDIRCVVLRGSVNLHTDDKDNTP